MLLWRHDLVDVENLMCSSGNPDYISKKLGQGRSKPVSGLPEQIENPAVVSGYEGLTMTVSMIGSTTTQQHFHLLGY